MKFFKKYIILSVIFSLLVNATGVFAGFVGEWAWLDFYKTIDKWYKTSQTRMIENALNNSAKNINFKLEQLHLKTLSKSIDFTKTELDNIADGWFTPIFTRIEFSDNNNPNADYLKNVAKAIQERYSTLKSETSDNIVNANKIAILWIYNDWDVGNSWYDIVTDIERIHSVIFNDAPKYNWVKNSAASDFNWVLSWLNWTNLSLNLSWAFNSWNNSSNSASNNSWTNSDRVTTNSNLCNTWISLIGLDDSLLNDLDRQVNLWDNSSSNLGWLYWPTNPYISGNLNTWWGTWLWWNKGYKWPCAWFICIKIEATSYSQWLLGWWSKTIEWLIDKNLKIITKTASKFLGASDITRWEFILSILRWLDLPSMLSLWKVITYMPPPILNLDKAREETEAKKIKNSDIFATTFKESGLSYIRSNLLDDWYETKDMWDSQWLNTDEAHNKNSKTKNAETPNVSATNVMIATIKNQYIDRSSDNIIELVWFSNSLRMNIKSITDYVDYMKDK